MVQGLLSGFALAFGYGVGVLLVIAYLFFELPAPRRKLEFYAKRVTVVLVAIIFVVCLWHMTYWQNSIRELMDMPPLQSAYPIRTAVLAVVFGVLLITVGRTFVSFCVWMSEKLNWFLPRRVAVSLGVVIVGLGTLFVVNGVVARFLLKIADAASLRADELIEEGWEKPADPMACGSSQSLVSWQSIGRQGKKFLLEGPTEQGIEEFWDGSGVSPIRVYVGMRSRSTPEERARLALQELKRVNAFDRSVLIVATPTGTGWLDPGAVDTVEYLHRGDTAIVCTQYSYMPSWLTILVDPTRSVRSARCLFDEIYDYWKTLPKDNRPRLYLHGLSLGSLGSEVSANLYTIFEDPIQGAVWSGPPFPSSQWSAVVQARNEDSPAWLPRYEDGALLRFTSQENMLDTGKRWGSIRSVYIQYASDPMVFFSPDLWRRKPEWLVGERGPDVSPHLTWYPLVTFLQVAFDLPMATSVPIGYGHNYSPKSYLDAWIAVTRPDDWSEEHRHRLLELMNGPVDEPDDGNG
ncbi:hypothetical protein FYK55_10130 [Roseiconus nitratireducens]|uniref:Alpha/beta-hydrolase family protein n=2 Tax=Roseiconus nitratireducens TaxID=2605748 RepID=A0A5M6DAZ0_9BACT|nr:hypothetical protein FYK55_10130 [Roseiconus nitratireducens]